MAGERGTRLGVCLHTNMTRRHTWAAATTTPPHSRVSTCDTVVSITDCSNASAPDPKSSHSQKCQVERGLRRGKQLPDKRHLIMSDRKSATDTPDGHAVILAWATLHPCHCASSSVRLHTIARCDFRQFPTSWHNCCRLSLISCGFQVHVKGLVLRLELCPHPPAPSAAGWVSACHIAGVAV